MPSECYKAGCRGWQCAFRAPEDFETLGRYLHPVQDFWSHSNAIFVSTCANGKCVLSVGICLDWECAEYKVDPPNYTGTEIPSSKIPEYWGVLSNLFSGLYGAEV